MNKPINTANEMAVALCHADFVRTWNKAREQMHGGSSWDQVAGLTLQEAMERFAPNGLRFVFVDEGHLEEFQEQGKKLHDELQKAMPFLPEPREEPKPTAEPDDPPNYTIGV